MREEFGKHLLELSKKDSKMYVLDCDLANSTKTNYVAEQNSSQFIQCGIAENNAMSMAAGMATAGLKPWIVSFSSFLVERCLDQIKVSVAQPNLNVKIIGCYTGILNGKVGKTHQAINDIAILRTIPNMVILCPADGIELIQMMNWANNYNGPVYIRLTRESEPIFTPYYTWISYSTIPIYLGGDITLISTGTHLPYAEKALLKLRENNINVSLIHVPMIKPINEEEIINIAKNTKHIITIEDHTIIGGLGSAIAEILIENYPRYLYRIGIKDKNIEAGTNEELLDKYELSVDYIYNKVIEILEKKG